MSLKFSECPQKKTIPVQLRTGVVENVCMMWYNKDKKKILAGKQEFRFSFIQL